jgi:hypothetical protein
MASVAAEGDAGEAHSTRRVGDHRGDGVGHVRRGQESEFGTLRRTDHTYSLPSHLRLLHEPPERLLHVVEWNFDQVARQRCRSEVAQRQAGKPFGGEQVRDVKLTTALGTTKSEDARTRLVAIGDERSC